MRSTRWMMSMSCSATGALPSRVQQQHPFAPSAGRCLCAKKLGNQRTGVYSTGTVEPTDLRTRSDDAGARIGLRRRGCAALSCTRVTQLVAQGGRTLFKVLSSKSAYYT